MTKGPLRQSELRHGNRRHESELSELLKSRTSAPSGEVWLSDS